MIDLVVIAKFVCSIESLKPIVNAIKQDVLFKKQMLKNKLDCGVTEEGKQHNLEIL